VVQANQQATAALTCRQEVLASEQIRGYFTPPTTHPN